MEQNVDELPVVFLHSGFRTGSTWLWGKIRSLASTWAYYEIFHESFALSDARSALSVDSSFWESNHPPLAPYFLESMPLFGEGTGIPGYQPEMALEQFIPDGGFGGALSEAEHAYVARLIAVAREHGKIPVLADKRTLGRIGALRREFGGTTILLHRNLFHQWASCSRHAVAGNPYFLMQVDTILKASRHDATLREIDDWTQARTILPNDEKMFLAFLFTHLYLYAIAAAEADLTVDLTSLSADPEYRGIAENRLSELLRAPVDLSDARASFEGSVVEVSSKAAFVDSIEQFTKSIASMLKDARSRDFLAQLKGEALAEWERSEFYATSLRRALAARIQTLEKDIDEAHVAMNASADERNALADRVGAAEPTLAALAAERDVLAGQMVEQSQAKATLVAERDDLAGQVSALSLVRVALSAERDGLAGRVAELSQGQAALAADRDALTGRIAELSQAQVALAAERDGLAGQLAEAAQAHTALAAERNGLAGQLTEMTYAREALAIERGGLTGRLAEAGHAHAALATERSALAKQFAEAARDQTALATERDGLARQIAEMSQAQAALTAERDALASQLAEAAKVQAALAGERDELAERLRRRWLKLPTSAKRSLNPAVPKPSASAAQTTSSAARSQASRPWPASIWKVAWWIRKRARRSSQA
ncbi:MAG: hypothetical protein ACRED9_03165 [Caulobacteraceae bacterium]